MGDTLNIHIVDSVKGGSGKSTFSAKLCCSLIEQGKKACVIDLDLLGTSWLHLYSNANAYRVNNPQYRLVFLNDLVKDFEYYKNMQVYQKLKFVYKTDSRKINLPCIFCNPDPIEKRLYRIEDVAKVDVNYSFFANVVLNLFEHLKDNGFSDIVLDMPPNSEPFSNRVLNLCLSVENDYIVSLYMVSNLNLSHIKSTFEWYSNFMKDTWSQHVAALNNLPAVDENEEFNCLSSGSSGKFVENKKEWLQKEPRKFFFVFNDLLDRTQVFEKTSVCESLILKTYDDIKFNLAYYFVGFDESFRKCTDSVFTSGAEEIEFSQEFNCENFKLLKKS